MSVRRRLLSLILKGNSDGWLVVEDDSGETTFKAMSYEKDVDAYRVELDDGVRYFDDPNDSLLELEGTPVGFADKDACEIVGLEEKVSMEVEL